MANKSAPRNKVGWYADHVRKYNQVIEKQAEVVLLGDSLVANLSRYPDVWDRQFAPQNTVNCGIGGDRTHNVLWRLEHLYLPATVSVGVIHCCINDINGCQNKAFQAHEIAQNVILCDSKLKERHPSMSIIIVGIPQKRHFFMGKKPQIEQVNNILKESCSIHGCWRDTSSGNINQTLFWRDGLHLNKRGCMKLAQTQVKIGSHKPSLNLPNLPYLPTHQSVTPYYSIYNNQPTVIDDVPILIKSPSTTQIQVKKYQQTYH